MPEYERVSAGAVLTEILFEFRRRLGLDVTHLRVQTVPDAHQSCVRAAVPRLIRYGTRGEQGYPEGVFAGTFALTTPSRSEKRDVEKGESACEKMAKQSM
jgi:hypothetical protein